MDGVGVCVDKINGGIIYTLFILFTLYKQDQTSLFLVMGFSLLRSACETSKRGEIESAVKLPVFKSDLNDNIPSRYVRCHRFSHLHENFSIKLMDDCCRRSHAAMAPIDLSKQNAMNTRSGKI